MTQVKQEKQVLVETVSWMLDRGKEIPPGTKLTIPADKAERLKKKGIVK